MLTCLSNMLMKAVTQLMKSNHVVTFLTLTPKTLPRNSVLPNMGIR